MRFLKKYLEENPVDVIVSTGPPHSMHLIAMKVAAATGIPWIADFRDPWTKMFYFKHLCLSAWAGRKHRLLESKVLDNADVVVAVSPLVQDEFKAMTDTPVELITNGFDEDDFDQVVEPFFEVMKTLAPSMGCFDSASTMRPRSTSAEALTQAMSSVESNAISEWFLVIFIIMSVFCRF